ncbi:metallophosphoesterase [Pseudoalteromonas sp. KAN5]|uniref:metallophosphoesterase n=1 Tax=Pseudoalteromonas sp. KAN5 TaxID=2916633 RepID=UPI001FCAFDCB|nr:metallophosphoesterase [Pseudoalteromonas sp. KAN5]BDF95327.1 3',5'-cyclic adenosine monophosphate phosphodiesterase CpdA [Pseudoalteromonas sp. KAN5]
MAWFDVHATFKHNQLRLAHITDSHLFADPQGEYFSVNTAEHFSRALAHMAAQSLDAVIFGGDLTQDHSIESYSLFAQLIADSALTCQVFWLPGNHDDIAAMKHISSGQISNAKRLIAQGFEVLLINSKGPTPAGWVSEVHLNEITELLANTVSPSVVFCHHNPLPINGYLDKHMLENGPQLLNMLQNSGQVRHVFHGHVHNDYQFQFRNIEVVATPASSVQFTKNSHHWQQQNLGASYRLLTIAKSSDDVIVDSELVWLNE